jgi:hypothetical protein
MKLWLIALQLLALTTLASAKHKVVTLTDENFDAKTRKGAWMIDVYAPWQVTGALPPALLENSPTRAPGRRAHPARADGIF